MNEKMRDILNVHKMLTGSIMSVEDILNEYTKISKYKKKFLYDKVKFIMKKFNGPFDNQQPILLIEFGLVSAELNVDPAVIMLAYTKKGK